MRFSLLRLTTEWHNLLGSQGNAGPTNSSADFKSDLGINAVLNNFIIFDLSLKILDVDRLDPLERLSCIVHRAIGIARETVPTPSTRELSQR